MSNTLLVAIAGYYNSLEWDQIQYIQLKRQTLQDYDVLLLDPYKDNERKKLLLTYFPHTAIYFPYTLPPMPRDFDWAIWNNAFLIGDYERILRFQQRRIISKYLIQYIYEHEINLSFQRTFKDWVVNEDKNLVEDFSSSMIQMQKHVIDPHTGYGDWCLYSKDFLRINGIDECFTVSQHSEDLDFNLRWRIAKNPEVNLLDDAIIYLKSLSFQKSDINLFSNLCCRDIMDGIDKDKSPPVYIEVIGRYNSKIYYQCRKCGGIFPKMGEPHYSAFEDYMIASNQYYATSNILNKYGRDLNAIKASIADIDNINTRIEYINKSWLG